MVSSLYLSVLAILADYWKSNARKFCDFCKCWIADNKPSIEFHEKGKRHKESVAQRLSDITKKSKKEHKAQLKVEDELRKMEEAALAAYMKDIEAGADYTSKILGGEIDRKIDKKPDDEAESLAPTETTVSVEDQETNVNKCESKWYEAKSDEGHTYYWHVETGESTWEAPEEGYVSIKKQKKLEKQAEKEAEKLKAQEEQLSKEEDLRIKEEQRAWVEREKMKSRRVKEEEKKPEENIPNTAMYGPAPRVDPYGGWQKVEHKVEEPVDLELPTQEFIPLNIPTVYEEPQRRFKEKSLPSTGLGVSDNGEVSFKKRKFNNIPKKNMRQRLSDD